MSGGSTGALCYVCDVRLACSEAYECSYVLDACAFRLLWERRLQLRLPLPKAALDSVFRYKKQTDDMAPFLATTEEAS